MKRSRMLVLAGAVIGVGLVARRARRPRARIPFAIPFVSVWIALLRGMPSIDLSPSTVFSGIAGFFGDVIMTLIGDLITPIADAISWAGVQLEQFVLDSVNSVWGFIGQAAGLVSTVLDFVQSLYQAALQYAESLVASVWFEVNSLADQFAQWGANILNLIQTTIASVLSTAMTVGGWLWNQIYNAFIYPLYNYISDLFGNIEGIVAGIVSTVINGALEAGGWLYNILTNIVQSLIDVALAAFGDIVAVVQGAWAFLVWIAEHPFSWFADQIDSVFGNGASHLIDLLEQAIDANQDQVEQWIDRVFA